MRLRVVPSKGCFNILARSFSSLPPVYVITDGYQRDEHEIVRAFQEVSMERGFLLQLREKTLGTRALVTLARSVLDQARRYKIPVLINDRVDVALAIGADGVHLRSTSLPIAVTRALVGSDCLIGFSAHSVEDVMRGEQEGADFAVLGPVYDTPSKRAYGPPLGLSLFETACHRSHIPIYAIGGVAVASIQDVLQAGGYGVAGISVFWNSEFPGKVIRELCTQFPAFS